MESQSNLRLPMRFFTPELYIDFNSNDPVVADAADGAWEKAISDYRKHIRKIRARLPKKARELADSTCLHDAGYLGYIKAPMPKAAGELAVIAAEVGGKIHLFIYVVSDEPSFSQAVQSDVFSDENVHWLYDELAELDSGTFRHEIQFSNGRILSLTFVAFDMLTVNKADVERLPGYLAPCG
jgi:hypothetical protein